MGQLHIHTCYITLTSHCCVIGHIMKPEAVIASNTSSLSISSLAQASGRPHRVIGLHFFIPQIVKLVEVVRTSHVSVYTCLQLCLDLIKHSLCPYLLTCSLTLPYSLTHFTVSLSLHYFTRRPRA